MGFPFHIRTHPEPDERGDRRPGTTAKFHLQGMPVLSLNAHLV